MINLLQSILVISFKDVFFVSLNLKICICPRAGFIDECESSFGFLKLSIIRCAKSHFQIQSKMSRFSGKVLRSVIISESNEI